MIDLDRTPLQQSEMHEMALRIWRVHRVAYESDGSDKVPPAFIDKLLVEVGKSRFRIAKPRLSACVLVDELELIRQRGEYREAKEPDLDKALSRVGSELAPESAP